MLALKQHESAQGLAGQRRQQAPRLAMILRGYHI